jgi:hypothetical protein
MILLIELFRSSVENCDGYFLTGPKPSRISNPIFRGCSCSVIMSPPPVELIPVVRQLRPVPHFSRTMSARESGPGRYAKSK